MHPKEHPLQHPWIRRMRSLSPALKREIRAFGFLYSRSPATSCSRSAPMRLSRSTTRSPASRRCPPTARSTSSRGRRSSISRKTPAGPRAWRARRSGRSSAGSSIRRSPSNCTTSRRHPGAGRRDARGVLGAVVRRGVGAARADPRGGGRAGAAPAIRSTSSAPCVRSSRSIPRNGCSPAGLCTTTRSRSDRATRCD